MESNLATAKQRGIDEGIAQGRKEGIIEGRAKGIISVARNALKGILIAVIANLTGLTCTAIKNIRS